MQCFLCTLDYIIFATNVKPVVICLPIFSVLHKLNHNIFQPFAKGYNGHSKSKFDHLYKPFQVVLFKMHSQHLAIFEHSPKNAIHRVVLERLKVQQFIVGSQSKFLYTNNKFYSKFATNVSKSIFHKNIECEVLTKERPKLNKT